MVENYGLQDHRGDAAYADWDAAYVGYRGYEGEQLKATNDIYAYLMLLADPNFDCYITVTADSAVTEDALFWTLIENAGGPSQTEANAQGGPIVIRRGADSLLDTVATEASAVENVEVEIWVTDRTLNTLVEHAQFVRGMDGSIEKVQNT